MNFDVVVPTCGRPSLRTLLDHLERSRGPRPGRVIVVDDERRGPAWARNRGWRQSHADWVAFLDDDVVPDADWLERLADDLARLPEEVAGSQGRIRVPLPSGRPATDWERNVAALEAAAWATADMAYRRAVLAEVGGFDERFRRAYREDADLALRVERAGYRLARGNRSAAHPVRRSGPLASLRAQAGNADDALIDALHGRGWRERARAPRGRLRWHAATTGLGAIGVLAAAARRRNVSSLALGGWAGLTADLARLRIAPGPRTPAEVATMLATSLLLPPAATYHRLRGEVRARRLTRPLQPWPVPGTGHGWNRRTGHARNRRPAAVLLDRDGTLVLDVPYNGEPDRVVPVADARAALDRLRTAGVALAVVSNQSGVARGLITAGQLDAVNRRVEELLGPIGTWLVCPHGPDEGCGCRKPAPGLLVRAARELGVEPGRCAVIGDIGADVEAALAVGARPILVPTTKTRPEEIEAAPEVAPTLHEAVDRLLEARS